MSEALDSEQVGAFTVEVHYSEGECNPREDYNHAWLLVAPRACSDAESWADGIERNCDTVAETYRVVRAERGPIIAVPIEAGSDWCRIADRWADADLFAYMPTDCFHEEWGRFHESTAEALANARRCLAAEVAELQAWRRGEVYGYVIRGEDGEHVDSSLGYVGESDYAMAEGRSAAQYLEAERWERWATLPRWVQESVLIAEDVR